MAATNATVEQVTEKELLANFQQIICTLKNPDCSKETYHVAALEFGRLSSDILKVIATRQKEWWCLPCRAGFAFSYTHCDKCGAKAVNCVYIFSRFVYGV